MNHDLLQKLTVLFLVFGPALIGLLVLLVICFSTRRFGWLFAGCALSLVAHFITFLFVFGLINIGGAGSNYTAELPQKMLLYGVTATGLIGIAKAIHLLSRRH